MDILNSKAEKEWVDDSLPSEHSVTPVKNVLSETITSFYIEPHGPEQVKEEKSYTHLQNVIWERRQPIHGQCINQIVPDQHITVDRCIDQSAHIADDQSDCIHEPVEQCISQSFLVQEDIHCKNQFIDVSDKQLQCSNNSQYGPVMLKEENNIMAELQKMSSMEGKSTNIHGPLVVKREPGDTKDAPVYIDLGGEPQKGELKSDFIHLWDIKTRTVDMNDSAKHETESVAVLVAVNSDMNTDCTYRYVPVESSCNEVGVNSEMNTECRNVPVERSGNDVGVNSEMNTDGTFVPVESCGGEVGVNVTYQKKMPLVYQCSYCKLVFGDLDKFRQHWFEKKHPFADPVNSHYGTGKPNARELSFGIQHEEESRTCQSSSANSVCIQHTESRTFDSSIADPDYPQHADESRTCESTFADVVRTQPAEELRSCESSFADVVGKQHAEESRACEPYYENDQDKIIGYQCQVCYAEFENVTQLGVHHKAHISAEQKKSEILSFFMKTMPCIKCKKTYLVSSIFSSKKEIETVHTYICHTCKHKACYRSIFQQSGHSCKCPWCGNACPSRCSLSKHTQVCAARETLHQNGLKKSTTNYLGFYWCPKCMEDYSKSLEYSVIHRENQCPVIKDEDASKTTGKNEIRSNLGQPVPSDTDKNETSPNNQLRRLLGEGVCQSVAGNNEVNRSTQVSGQHGQGAGQSMAGRKMPPKGQKTNFIDVGDRPFWCRLCGQTFNSLVVTKMHDQVHRNEYVGFAQYDKINLQVKQKSTEAEKLPTDNSTVPTKDKCILSNLLEKPSVWSTLTKCPSSAAKVVTLVDAPAELSGQYVLNHMTRYGEVSYEGSCTCIGKGRSMLFLMESPKNIPNTVKFGDCSVRITVEDP